MDGLCSKGTDSKPAPHRAVNRNTLSKIFQLNSADKLFDIRQEKSESVLDVVTEKWTYSSEI